MHMQEEKPFYRSFMLWALHCFPVSPLRPIHLGRSCLCHVAHDTVVNHRSGSDPKAPGADCHCLVPALVNEARQKLQRVGRTVFSSPEVELDGARSTKPLLCMMDGWCSTGGAVGVLGTPSLLVDPPGDVRG